MSTSLISEFPKKVLNCTLCQCHLRDSEHARTHNKSEWHSHNYKRKIANLSILSLEDYIKKVVKEKELKDNESVVKPVYSCKVCNKTFKNQSTHDDHVNSKKHKDNVKKSLNTLSIEENDNIPDKKDELSSDNDDLSSDDEDIEEVDSDEWDEDIENPIDKNQCLFCSQTNGNFHKNLEHMVSFHSFFIPDIEYCIDVEGLLKYLGEKVEKGYMCLFCNEKGRTFYSADAAKSHMIDKGHCMMIFEGVALTEYVDFYDYSSTHPDADNCLDKDEEVSINILDSTDSQLVLPSGAVIGHRSLLRYYKQNASRCSAVVPSKNTKKLHKVLATYRALGWSQTDQEEAARKARDIHYLKRVQSKWSTKMGIKNNKFQKHFRQQVNY